MCCWFVFLSIRVELSEMEFLDLSHSNHFEHICEELFSSIKNERYGIDDDQTLSVQVWFKFQWTRDLLCWFVPSSLSGSGMCEDGFAGTTPWTRKTVMFVTRRKASSRN